jgi:hypothetical protein
MANKPIKNNRFKGDTKLKHVLPTYDRSEPDIIRKQRRARPEEVIPDAEEDFRLKKEVREDDEQGPRSRFRRKDQHIQVKKIPPPPEPPSGTAMIKLIVIVIGIIILISSMAIAYQTRNDGAGSDEDSIKDDGYHFLENLLISEELGYDNPPQRGVFSAFKVQYVTGEELELSLEPEFNFYIEIIDASDHPVKYTRSEALGNAISNTDRDQVPDRIEPSSTIPNNLYNSNGSEVFLLNSYVNIKVSDTEVHAAKLIVMIWI